MSVYNGERYLREAIESILGQTFKDFEFIIIDDGSTDSSKDIILYYKDPRIRLIENKKNICLTKSLNKGIKAAQGEYIARMDADDISLPKRLKKQIDFLDEHKDVGVLGTTFYHIDNEGKIIFTKIVPLKNDIIQKELLKKNCFAHGSIMMRKDILEKVGGYREQIKYSQDYDLFLRIAKHCKMANLEEALYKWRLHEDTVSISKRKTQKKYIDLVSRLKGKESGQTEIQEADSKRAGQKRMGELYRRYGINFIRQAANKSRKTDYFTARKRFKTSLKYYPWSMGNWVLLLLSFLPFKIIKFFGGFKKKVFKKK